MWTFLSYLSFFIYRATFYLVDASFPLRKQVYAENLRPLKKQYTFADLCEELEPPDIPMGEYRMIRSHPQVYMYIFSVTEQASKAKLTDFTIQQSTVANKLILPELAMDVSIHVKLFDLSDQRMFTRECVVGLIGSVRKFLHNEVTADEFKQEADMYIPVLEIASDGKGPKQSEVAINNTFIDNLRKSVFLPNEFHLEAFSTGMTSRCVTKYGTSRQDVIIYHKTKYINKGMAAGAILSAVSSEQEYESEDTPTIESDVECNQEHGFVGSAFEMKLSVEDNLGQLAANMLRLAGQLCEKYIREERRPMLLKEIKIYGALIEIRTSSAKPACLHMCFNKKSELLFGQEMMPIAECMYCIQKVLSVDCSHM